MRRIGDDERRARLGLRQCLAGTAMAGTPVEVADSLVALHATDPASVFLSVFARAPSTDTETIEQSIYGERSLIRMLGMRRTMFVVPVDLAPVIQAACTNSIAQAQRAAYVKFLSAAGVGDDAWLKEVEQSTARALTIRGEAYGSELYVDEPRLRTRVVIAEGKPYSSKQTITTWVLLLLAAEGRIVRGQPRGSWTSSQWRWMPIEAWLPNGVPVLAPETARAELVRRWLQAFGPGTVADLRWWTGWTAASVRQALGAVGAVEVDLDGKTGFVLADDQEPVPPPEPWVALLPALDPTAMGWYERSWYLGDLAPLLIDRGGNMAPTVWCDGRVVGGWTQRADGEIGYRLVEDIGAEATTQVAAAAERLASWVGPARLSPRTRLRPPLETDLLS